MTPPLSRDPEELASTGDSRQPTRKWSTQAGKIDSASWSDVEVGVLLARGKKRSVEDET